MLLLLCSCCLLLSSCFEITEEVNMNPDGSGDVVLTINMSESKDKLKAYMQRGEIEGVAIPDKAETEAIIDRIQNTLADLSGFSNLQSQSDFETFIFTFSGDFSDIRVLNIAINTIAKELNRTTHPTILKDNFSFEGNEFKRLFGYPIDKELYGKLSTMEQFVMETARIVSIYRFKETIQNYSNRKARLSPTKRALMMICSPAEIAKGEITMANTVTF